MFGKKKRNPFLEMFERENAGDDSENLTIQEKVRLFIKTFPLQSADYKIVWSVRILCWILVLAVAVFGCAVRIKQYFN